MRHFVLGVLAMGALLAISGRAAAFDARNPNDVLSVIAANGASGQLKTDNKGAPWIDAKAGKLGFEIDFTGCDSAKTHCKSMLYAIGFDMTSITLDQINGWNRWALFCPAYLTTENHPRAWFAMKVSAAKTATDVTEEENAWLTCMNDFDKFTDDPNAFLKSVS